MTSHSKYFKIVTENTSCADFVHCGNSCWEMFRWNALNLGYGCCKFIGPVSVIPILLRFRELNTDLIKQCCKKFLEYSAAAWLMSVIGLSFMCCYYKLFGKFYTWSILATPAASSAVICSIICSNRLILMFSRGLSSMVTEAIVKLYADDFVFLRLLRDSPVALTLAFMAANTSIIYALRQIKSDVFWFIQPYKVEQSISPAEKVPSPIIDRILPTEMQYCQHKSSCDSFLQHEIINYLKFGIGIEFVRIIFGNAKHIARRPLKFFAFEFFQKIKLNFVGFLVGYAGIYRTLTCFLTRLMKEDSTNNHLVAALISGTTFYAYPQLSLFGHAFTTAVELLWSIYFIQHKGVDRKQKSIPFLDKIPWSRIIYPIFFGYLCYLRPFYPWATPKIMMSILRGVTLNRESQIMKAYCSRLMSCSDPNVLYLFGMKE
ncbi:hypothetical protein Bhyg_11218 [Pseudolycoriella hygida]|uniref:Transmembrane protein 135 N-terminal domain-containing protein n=1 Tax=Pseudolycoriella hygida TaxID=35572 RepID=A0A9Q0MUZ4_9DIPT|nr:hypothetical protein Bhyg_11218 [Pseudolycoriella hygida]